MQTWQTGSRLFQISVVPMAVPCQSFRITTVSMQLKTMNTTSCNTTIPYKTAKYNNIVLLHTGANSNFRGKLSWWCFGPVYIHNPLFWRGALNAVGCWWRMRGHINADKARWAELPEIGWLQKMHIVHCAIGCIRIQMSNTNCISNISPRLVCTVNNIPKTQAEQKRR